MKSAYELALERLEERGIERPQEGGLPDATRTQMAEIKKRAEAKLAEIEILHRDSLPKFTDPVAFQQAQEDYIRERRRIEERCDREIAKLREDL